MNEHQPRGLPPVTLGYAGRCGAGAIRVKRLAAGELLVEMTQLAVRQVFAARGLGHLRAISFQVAA